MHFNDMSAKSRQLGLSLVVAALGLAAVLLYRKDDMAFSITIFGNAYSSHISGALVMFSAFAILAVRQLDLNVYHKMLRGAVAFGEDIEMAHLAKDIINTEKGLTGAVSHFSRHSDASVSKCGNNYHYNGSKGGSAKKKINFFYYSVFAVTFVMGLFLIYDFWKSTPLPATVEAGRTSTGNTSTSSDKNSSGLDSSNPH